MVLEQALQRERPRPLARVEAGVGIDPARPRQMRDDQAAVGDEAAVVVLDERQLALRALTRVADRDHLVRQAGELEPGLEFEGERADVAAEDRRELIELDHPRGRPRAQDSLRPMSSIASSSRTWACSPSTCSRSRLLGGTDREHGGAVADLLQRARLFLGDARHGVLGTPAHARLELGPVTLDLTLGLLLGVLDDRARPVLAAEQLALVAREQALRLLAQALGLVELGAHLGGMPVERAEDYPAHRLVDHRDEQDDQRDQQPQLEHQAALSSTRRSAACAVRLGTLSPASRCAAA